VRMLIYKVQKFCSKSCCRCRYTEVFYGIVFLLALQPVDVETAINWRRECAVLWLSMSAQRRGNEMWASCRIDHLCRVERSVYVELFDTVLY